MAHPPLRVADVRGAALHYVEQGDGPPVVFVHGAMADHRVWEPQREAVAARHRYVAFDQRHFGADRPDGGGRPYSLATHADDLAAFIDGIGARPAHVVGWSYGGAVALALAARHPAVVASLFLVEPALMSVASDEDDVRVLREERRQLAPAMAAAAAADLPQATRLFSEWVDADPGGFDRLPPALRAIFLDNAHTVPLHFASTADARVTCADLRALDIPTEVTVGGRTRPFFRILAETTSRCLRGRLTVIEGARHLAPQEHPAAFNAALLRFLGER